MNISTESTVQSSDAGERRGVRDGDQAQRVSQVSFVCVRVTRGARRWERRGRREEKSHGINLPIVRLDAPSSLQRLQSSMCFSLTGETTAAAVEAAAGAKRPMPDAWGEMTKKQRKYWTKRHWGVR